MVAEAEEVATAEAVMAVAAGDGVAEPVVQAAREELAVLGVAGTMEVARAVKVAAAATGTVGA